MFVTAVKRNLSDGLLGRTALKVWSGRGFADRARAGIKIQAEAKICIAKGEADRLSSSLYLWKL